MLRVGRWLPQPLAAAARPALAARARFNSAAATPPARAGLLLHQTRLRDAPCPSARFGRLPTTFCLGAELDTRPFGVDAAFLPGSRAYDPALNASQFYDTSHGSPEVGPSGVPYGFFAQPWVGFPLGFPVVVQAGIAGSSAGMLAAYMVDGGYLDNNTATLTMEVLTYNAAAGSMSLTVAALDFKGGGGAGVAVDSTTRTMPVGAVDSATLAVAALWGAGVVISLATSAARVLKWALCPDTWCVQNRMRRVHSAATLAVVGLRGATLVLLILYYIVQIPRLRLSHEYEARARRRLSQSHYSPAYPAPEGPRPFCEAAFHPLSLFRPLRLWALCGEQPQMIRSGGSLLFGQRNAPAPLPSKRWASPDHFEKPISSTRAASGHGGKHWMMRPPPFAPRMPCAALKRRRRPARAFRRCMTCRSSRLRCARSSPGGPSPQAPAPSCCPPRRSLATPLRCCCRGARTRRTTPAPRRWLRLWHRRGGSSLVGACIN